MYPPTWVARAPSHLCRQERLPTRFRTSATRQATAIFPADAMSELNPDVTVERSGKPALAAGSTRVNGVSAGEHSHQVPEGRPDVVSELEALDHGGTSLSRSRPDRADINPSGNDPLSRECTDLFRQIESANDAADLVDRRLDTLLRNLDALLDGSDRQELGVDRLVGERWPSTSASTQSDIVDGRSHVDAVAGLEPPGRI